MDEEVFADGGVPIQHRHHACSRGRVRIFQGTILNVQYPDMVPCPETTAQVVEPLFDKDLAAGVRIVSHGFDMLDWKADKEVKITKARNDVIYLWIIPATGR